MEKVKHTLKQFIKRNQYLKYDRLIIYILKRKQDSYSETAIQSIIQNKFNFESQRDIWDYCNILKEVSNFQIDKTLRIQEILEAYFGENQRFSSVLAARSRQKIDWRETCRNLLSHWKGLTTNALMKRGGVRFQLDEIFVPLGVVERREKSKHRSNDGASAEQGSELYEEKITPISQNDFFEQVLRQRQSKHSQGKRIAIIGEPGTGKTTQLQKIGDWILEETDEIPIWIPLAEVGTRKLREYLLGDWLQAVIQELEVLPEHRDELGQLLRTGKVWLLLDGVDEMAISDALYQIATQMREGWLQNVRVVLTCRLNVWDAGKNALDSFDVYRNLDFEYPTEVHQLVDKWFSTEPALQQKLKVALEKPGKERIRDMVKNPLRLTLLCYSWQLQQGELPETKAGLYEWFVDTFYEWNKGKVPIKLSAAKREELNCALGELAKEAIDQESSRFRLRERFINRFLGTADDEDSLFYLALQLGWLNRIGVAAENSLESVYAFFHPTFQEYFAVLAIPNWDFFLNHNNQNPNPFRQHNDKDCAYRIFDLQWREVILLWLGLPPEKIPRQYKNELIASLVQFNSGCVNTYSYQAISLAAAGLGQFDNFQSALIVLDYLTTTICFCHTQEIAEPARAVLGETDKTAATVILSLLAMLDEDEHTRRESAYLLGKLDLSSEIAAQSFNKLIRDAQDEWSLWKSAGKYLEIDSNNEIAISTLIHLAKNAHDKHVRRFSTWDLGKAKQGNETVISFFIDYIRNKKDIDGFYESINGLEKVGIHQQKVINFLIDLICNIQDEEVHYDIIYGFGRIAPNNRLAVEELEKLVQKSEDECILLHTACCLNQVAIGNKLASSALRKLAHSSAKNSYRSEAIITLLRNDSKDLLVLEDLSKMIQKTQDESTLDYVFEVLGEEFGSDTHVFTALIPALTFLCQNSTEENIKRLAARYLGEIDPDNQIAIQLLSDLCQNSQNEWIRVCTAKDLEEIQPGNSIATQSLQSLIHQTESEELRLRAATNLGEIDPGNFVAIETLLYLCKNSDSLSNRGEAARCLVKINPGNSTAIHTLVRVIIQSNENIAWSLTWDLGNIEFDPETMISALIEIAQTISFANVINSVFKRIEEIGYANKVAINLLIRLIDSSKRLDVTVEASKCLIRILRKDQLSDTLKHILRLLPAENHPEYSTRFSVWYPVFWHCTQNMSYPNFYQVWHSFSLIDEDT